MPLQGTVSSYEAGQNIAAVPPASPMQVHAATLHELASRLQDANDRLSNAIDRMTGPQPPNTSENVKQPTPDGALMVAQFGAERIRQGMDRLMSLVDRLNGIV